MKKNMTVRKKHKNDYKTKNFNGVCYHCRQKGRMSFIYRERRDSNKKKNEKAKKVIDREVEDDLVLCLLMREI